jgi:hypothetical protein
MPEKRWVPVPYYYTSPLAKVKAPTALPHPLGYIPKYLRGRESGNCVQLPKVLLP